MAKLCESYACVYACTSQTGCFVPFASVCLSLSGCRVSLVSFLADTSRVCSTLFPFFGSSSIVWRSLHRPCDTFFFFTLFHQNPRGMRSRLEARRRKENNKSNINPIFLAGIGSLMLSSFFSRKKGETGSFRIFSA